VGTLDLEFKYLSDITGDPIFRQKAQQVNTVYYTQHTEYILHAHYTPYSILHHTIRITLYASHQVRDTLDKSGRFGNKAGSPEGVFALTFKSSGTHCQNKFSIGGQGDSFYEYLLKSWLVSDKKDEQALRMWEGSMKVIMAKYMHKARAKGGEGEEGTKVERTYIYSPSSSTMEHLACFTGGMFAMHSENKEAGITIGGGAASHSREEMLAVGKGLTLTCRESYRCCNSSAVNMQRELQVL
jgi:mannosyl-oligosaccharide alpha-1,2-mannosidase